MLSTAPFLQGFDFESDPADGAFWAQFLQGGGFGAELAAAGGGEGAGGMGLLLPMPMPEQEGQGRMEEDYPVAWGGEQGGWTGA